MIHQKIREERERLGMTQIGVAREARVARSQLAAFEGGANISLATLEKILGQISTLRLDVIPADLDLEQARRAAAELEAFAGEMQAAAARLVTMLGSAPLPAVRQSGRAGAEPQSEDVPDISPQRRAALQRLVEEIPRSK